MKNLAKQKVVVLGGTSGIGLAVARAAKEDGADVFVVSSQKSKVDATGLPGAAVNLKDEGAVKSLFESIGALDHLVYTAGDALTLGPLSALDLSAAAKAFELRILGAMCAVKHARISKGGSVTLTHGIAGARPGAGWSVGASICGAMESLTRAIAVELAPIRVNAVSPGFVRTSLWDGVPNKEALFSEAAKKLPLGRIGEASDLADSYLYLMKNEFTTGQTIIADGGALVA